MRNYDFNTMDAATCLDQIGQLLDRLGELATSDEAVNAIAEAEQHLGIGMNIGEHQDAIGDLIHNGHFSGCEG